MKLEKRICFLDLFHAFQTWASLFTLERPIDPAEYKTLDADTHLYAHIAWVPPLQLPLHRDHLAS